MTDPSPYLFWMLSRVAGISAMLLAGMSISFGLAMAGRLGRGKLADKRVLHEALSIAVLVSLVVHALALLGDSYLKPSIFDLAIPFVFNYQTLWTSLGIIAGWSMIALGLSYYARRLIGPSRQKVIHRFAMLAWVAGIVHALGEGTDAAQPWFLVILALAVIPPFLLLGIRVTERRPARPRPTAATQGVKN
jgi:sulfoxide reductase heme-binding subunit YedZ